MQVQIQRQGPLFEEPNQSSLSRENDCAWPSALPTNLVTLTVCPRGELARLCISAQEGIALSSAQGAMPGLMC